MNRIWILGVVAWLGLSQCVVACGGVPSENAEYPDVKLRSMALQLDIKDERKNVLERIVEANKLYKNESVSFPQQLPEAFEQQATARLATLTSDRGLNLNVIALVDRADLSFTNDFDGDTTRYDVTLSFRITTEDGTVLQKGKGSSFQELPTKQADAQEMQRRFLVAALNAFDQYFADEDTLERLNKNIDAYLKAHPDQER